MRHLKRGRKLGRSASHRRALIRNLTASLFLHGRIITTVEKAKEARRFAEALITFARKGHAADTQEKKLHYFRQIHSRLDHKDATRKVFNEIGPAMAERNGGYTRILRLAKNRLGDNASQAVFELVNHDPQAAADAS
ncbi:MAG: 50S ribosomal protein L17 [Planctomycetota bacterium]